MAKKRTPAARMARRPATVRRKASKPTTVTIRTYRVGFGDCFLLSIGYADPGQTRHVLIDFGSTHLPEGAQYDLGTIAQDIKRDCGGKLHVLVATHRHKDHIAGFATTGKGRPGEVIASLKPGLVVQPWTEHPDVEQGAVQPLKARSARQLRANFARSLSDMSRVAESVPRALKHLRTVDRKLLERIAFIGDDNVKNKNAVENLIRMGRAGRAAYVSAGQRLRTAALLPGVQIDVLGPPTVKQWPAITRMAARNEQEYWHLQATAQRDAGADAESPFAEARPTVLRDLPIDVRWLVRRLRTLQASELLSIVTSLDDQMNNTSLILLFTIGDKVLLFPGDAQYENWSFALSDKKLLKRLAEVDLYKVGHHGSLNATPKTLWQNFAKRGKAGKARLISLLSTEEGVHGSEQNNSEVPRGKLVTALRSETTLVSTLDRKRDGERCDVTDFAV